MGQYEKDKKELLEKIEQLEHKLKKAKQSGDKDDVDKYSRKLADRRAKLASLGSDFQRTGQISDDILWKRLVNQVPDGCRLTSVMDCCHSGTGLDLPFTYEPRGLPRRRRRRHGHGGDGRAFAVHGARRPLVVPRSVRYMLRYPLSTTPRGRPRRRAAC